MRVLHILTQKPGETGSGIYLRALLRQAGLAGHVSGAVVGLGPGEEPELENLYPVRFETEDLPFPVIGMSDVMPYRSTTWSSLDETGLDRYRQTFAQALKRAVSDFQPEVLHCHHVWVLSALVRELFPDLRVVCSCHGTGLRQGAKLPTLFESIKPSLAKLDACFALTREQVARLPIAPDRVEVVGSGFRDEVFFRKSQKSGPFRVLYAGKLSRSKGVLELLEAVAPLLGDDFQLALAGGGHGEETEAIRARASELGVELLGRLDHPRLAEAMNRAHVFVLPSYYEGLPLVLVEALACDCRLVVSSLPGVMDWLPESLLADGWVTPVTLPEMATIDRPKPEALEGYVERLRRALLEQSKASPRTPASLETFVAQHTWTGVYQKIASYYKPRGAQQ